MLNKVRYKSWIRLFIRIHFKYNRGLFWTETNPASRFCGNVLSSLFVILRTNQPTDRQMEGEHIVLINAL